MAVYNGSPEASMFLGITINNIKVSFLCFAAGILTSFGTGLILLQNGIMLGSFQMFFYQHDLLWESALAVWLHGTLEIWAIIVAGAAGLALGNSWLFPGTYSRLESFRRGAKRARPSYCMRTTATASCCSARRRSCWPMLRAAHPCAKRCRSWLSSIPRPASVISF